MRQRTSVGSSETGSLAVPPFAPWALPHFIATMKASDFCVGNRLGLGHYALPADSEPGPFLLARPNADLLRSVAGLVYMPWSRTPVVSMRRGSHVGSPDVAVGVRRFDRYRLDAAFASAYWLGHHGTH